MKLYQPLQERFLASVDCIVASSLQLRGLQPDPEKISG